MLLKHQVDDLLTRHSEEVSARDDMISQLNAELDAKASIIALLTQQLCQVRAKLKQELEARSKQSIVCACPHCFVHRKAIPSTEGRLSPLQEADHSMDGTELSATGKLLIPSPPSATLSVSPHPPPPMAGRKRLIKRRASTPIRRQSPSPRNSLTNLSLDSSKDIAQKTLRPARVARDPSLLSTELQELLSLKDDSAKPVRRDTHPVLPPIPSPHAVTDNMIQDNMVTDNYSHVHRFYPGPGIGSSQQLPVQGVTDGTSSINAHRRLILTKSKGLSSAPSALRVLHYGARNRSDAGAGGGAEERGKGEEEQTTVAQEGTLLLVKENNPGRGPPQCTGTEGTRDCR